jgi:hypothetical protein
VREISNNGKKTIIFISTGIRTGSTLLTNIIYGLIHPNFPAQFMSIRKKRIIEQPNITIVKTHIKPDILSNMFKQYNLIFLTIRRYDKKVKVKEYTLSNTQHECIVIPYENLLYTSEDSRDNVINYIHDLIKPFILNIKLNINDCKTRLNKMENIIEKMKLLPFREYDDFYLIHGGHRFRDKKNKIYALIIH